MAERAVGRDEIVRFRFARHQLDGEADTAAATAIALLDYGVQDTGPDGSAWALTIRGGRKQRGDALALAWTLRGAPHLYRRADLGAVAVATAPFSEVDAGKRIFDANRPLKAAGISALDALTTVARHLRAIVRRPVAKGDASGRLTDEVDAPYVRYCRPCQATHVYEMPFRMAALQAGLELEAGTSPPVLRRVPGLRPPLFGRLAGEATDRFDVVRNHLRFYGPTRVKDVATFLGAPPREVEAHWPTDAVPVTVRGGPARDSWFALDVDVDELTGGAGGSAAPAVRLLGPFDPFLQLRDRETLVAGTAHRKDLWRTLGRPGAVVAKGEVIGTWRPQASGRKLTVKVEPWTTWRRVDRARVHEQAERLAAHRGVTLTAVTG